MRQRLDATRARIVASATGLITAAGYAGCSVAAVGARAGVATGTIYRFFPSKGELFVEVFRQVAAREVAAAAAAGDAAGSARAGILAAAGTFCARAFAAPKPAYALLAEPVDPLVDAERLAFHDSFTDLLAATIRTGIANGELAPQHPRVSAAAIVGAVAHVLVVPLARGTADATVMPQLLSVIDRALGEGSNHANSSGIQSGATTGGLRRGGTARHP